MAIGIAGGGGVGSGGGGGNATSGTDTLDKVVIVGAGSASDNSIQPSGDANTGIRFPAADTVNITTSGTLAFQVDSSNKCWMTAAADVATTITAGGVAVDASTIPANGIYLPAGNIVGVATNSAQRIQIYDGAVRPATDDNMELGITGARWKRFWLNYTDSSGTPGNVTNSKPSGVVAIAAAATAVVVTNTLVSTTSVVMVTPMDLDATATLYKCVPASGSFTITANAAATATTRFMFLVVN